MRILALITDAYGGHGGIAVYNRDFLRALCENPDTTEVVAIPRLIVQEQESLPDKLTHVTSGIGGKIAYLKTVFSEARSRGPFDLIVCGHLNILPLALLLRRLLKLPVLLQIHGIDAWKRAPKWLPLSLFSKVDGITSISNVTAKRFREWSKVPDEICHDLPNAIHADDYGPGPKPPELARRYGITDQKVLMTFGRLVSRERGKGFDEVLEVLPDLLQLHSDLKYLIAGTGPDRGRLESKSRELGVSDNVIFTGFVEESEKSRSLPPSRCLRHAEPRRRVWIRISRSDGLRDTCDC